MRLSVQTLLFFAILLCALTSAQEFRPERRYRRDSELGDPEKTIADNLAQIDRTILASHHLQLPLHAPLRDLLDDKSKTWTLFVPSNKAKREELQAVEEMFCENGELVKAEGKYRRMVKKEMIKEVIGEKGWKKPHMTDADCESLAKLIELDEKVMRDTQRLRRLYHSANPHARQLKLMLTANADEYRKIHFSPDVEAFVRAKYAYIIVPGKVDIKDIGTPGKKTLPTLLSMPDQVPLNGFESNTKLVLRKGNEGGLSIIFASPKAPWWRVEVDETPIEASNGRVYVTRQTVPYPLNLDQSLLYNKLTVTHALLNYTGLLDKLEDKKDMTLLAPSDAAWMKVLARMLDKPTIRRMARDVERRHKLMLKLPDIQKFKRIQRGEEEEEEEPRIRHSTIEAEYVPLRIQSEEVEPDIPAEEPFEVSQLARLDKSEVRDLLMSHVLDGLHFSEELSRVSTITALSGANLPVKADRAQDQFVIGKSHTLFSDIPIKNGAMHIVDDVVTAPTRMRIFAPRH